MQVSPIAFRKRSKPRRKSATAATPVAVDYRATLACRLDHNADALLFLGAHIAAERLSLRAQALREAGR